MACIIKTGLWSALNTTYDVVTISAMKGADDARPHSTPAEPQVLRGLRPQTICSKPIAHGAGGEGSMFSLRFPLPPSPFPRRGTMLPSGALSQPKTLADLEIWKSLQSTCVRGTSYHTNYSALYSTLQGILSW